SAATLESAGKPRAIVTEVAGERQWSRGRPREVNVAAPASRLTDSLDLKSITGGDVSGLEIVQRRAARQISQEYRGANILGHVHAAQTDRKCPYGLDTNVGAQTPATNVLGKADRARDRLPAGLQTIDLALRERKGTAVSIQLAADIIRQAVPSTGDGKTILPLQRISQLVAQRRCQGHDGILLATVRGDRLQRAATIAQQRVRIIGIKAPHERQHGVRRHARPHVRIPSPLRRAAVALSRLHDQR